MDQETNYQFIQVPLNLFYLMDANCSKVFITLVQMDSYYPKEDGYFECAYKTLELACGLSRPVIKASLAGLYLEGLLDVVSVGQGRGKHTNRYKVNVEKFKDYEKFNVGIAIMTEDKPIHQVKYKGERFQVPWNEISTEKQSEKGTEKQSEKKVTTNIDNVSNLENIDNEKNIYNESNIVEETPKEDRYKNLTWEEYLKLFINKHPSFNYNLDNSIFVCTYTDILDTYRQFIKDKTSMDIPIPVLARELTYYATFGRAYAGEEVTRPA